MEPKTINGQVYWHYSRLFNWEKNEKVRYITQSNWLKLLADIKRNGVEGVSQIDEQGIVYDGNHRLKAVKHLIENEGVTTSENNQELAYLPVFLKNPQTEAQKWRIVLSANEQFPSWNQNELANFTPEFENELDLSLINISFTEPVSFDTLTLGDEFGEKDQGQDKKQVEATCPSCGHKFAL